MMGRSMNILIYMGIYTDVHSAIVMHISHQQPPLGGFLLCWPFSGARLARAYKLAGHTIAVNFSHGVFCCASGKAERRGAPTH